MTNKYIRKFNVNHNLLYSSIEHVFYEIQSLYFLYLINKGAISILIKQTESQILNNIILEATLVHCRCLIDFYEKKSRTRKGKVENDDILSKDYFAYEAKPLDSGNAFIKYKDRINKDLAHLSYSRTERNNETKKWPIIEILKPIFIRSIDFISHILKNNFTGNISQKEWEILSYNLNMLIK